MKIKSYGWWKWIALILLLLLLFCWLFKCCDNNRIHDGDLVSIEDQLGNDWFPDKPNRLFPIDTSMIEILPGDPLKREVVTNLINVYCQDTIDLKRMAQEFILEFPEDSIKTTYYAEEYKRIQFQIPPAKRDTLKASLRLDLTDVKYVVDEWVISGFQQASIPSDPGFSDSDKNWFYKQIGLFEAWNEGYGNEDIVIAVLDDSFDANHPELKGQLVSPWNVIDYSDQINTNNNKFHGTHVAGTVAGNAQNNFGISGVAPKCKIMPVQIADKNGNMSITSILDGIFYALKNDADVINMSLGQELGHLAGASQQEQLNFAKDYHTDEAKMWDEIYKIAEKENVIIVQAAGNSSVLASIDPMKRSSSSLIVGALDRSKRVADFSNLGKTVNVFAPGVEIFSALPGGKEGPLDGTSMASPIVAGCVALIKSKKRDIKISRLIKLLNNTGEAVSNETGTLIRIDKILASL